jgi:hypothetical protein
MEAMEKISKPVFKNLTLNQTKGSIMKQTNKTNTLYITSIKDALLDEDGCPICTVTPHTPNFIKAECPIHNEITTDAQCDCLAYCGDDPRVVRKEIAPCKHLGDYWDKCSKREETKINLITFIHNTRNGTLKKLLKDCLELI